MEEADRIAPAADAGHEQVGQTLLAFENLLPRLEADDAVKVAHHHRERMTAQRAAENIMRRAHVRHPVAHRFIYGLLQRRLPRRNGAHLRAEEFHARHVQCLALHVHLPHVNHALEAKARAHRRRRHAMLARARLGDDALLPQPHRQQRLTQRIVDLVRAGVEQILALQINLRATQFLRPALGEIQRCRPPDIVMQQVIQLRLEGRVRLGLFILLCQLCEGGHERLRHKHAAVLAEVAVFVRDDGQGKRGDGHGARS